MIPRPFVRRGGLEEEEDEEGEGEELEEDEEELEEGDPEELVVNPEKKPELESELEFAFELIEETELAFTTLNCPIRKRSP